MHALFTTDWIQRRHGSVAYGRRLLTSTMILGALAIPAAAVAQTDSTSAQSEAATVRMDPSPLQKMAQDAYDHGVYFNLYYIGELAANPIGGARQGNAYNGHLRLDTAFDLQKLLGIPGASFHFTFTDRSGENLSTKRIDTDGFVQQLYGSDETYIFSKFEYVQKLFDNRADFMVGRMDLSDTFDRSEFYCLFQSDLDCGNPTGLAKDISKAAFPTPVWGGVLRIRPTPNIYAMAGAYQVDPTDDNPLQTHGLNWSTTKSTGYTLPVELGYKWRTPGAVDDNRYDIGMVLDHATYSAKTPFGKAFYSPSSVTGRTVLYAQAQQMLWQAQPDTKQGIYLAANVVYGASGSKQTENFDWNTNLVWIGPFAARPDDYLGFAFGGQHYNNAFLNALYKSRVAEHGTQYPDSWQFMGELNYSIQVNRWLEVLPNIQWIIHPNGLGFSTYAVKNVPSALVFGLQFNVSIAKLLGIPVGPKNMMDWVDNSSAYAR